MVPFVSPEDLRHRRRGYGRRHCSGAARTTVTNSKGEYSVTQLQYRFTWICGGIAEPANHCGLSNLQWLVAVLRSSYQPTTLPACTSRSPTCRLSSRRSDPQPPDARSQSRPPLHQREPCVHGSPPEGTEGARGRVAVLEYRVPQHRTSLLSDGQRNGNEFFQLWRSDVRAADCFDQGPSSLWREKPDDNDLWQQCAVCIRERLHLANGLGPIPA